MVKSKKKSVVAAMPASTIPATIRNIRKDGTAGMGPGGILGGNGGSKTPAPCQFTRRAATAARGRLRLQFKLIFGEVVRHVRKCYSVAKALSRRGGRPLRP